MTKREFFENELKMKPSEIGTAVPFNPNGETEITEEWLISFIKNLLAERSKWHTETPTEEGDYFVAFRWGLDNEIMHDMASHVLYGATAFVNGNWRIDFPYVVVAWQKIESYKENEDGHTD